MMIVVLVVSLTEGFRKSPHGYATALLSMVFLQSFMACEHIAGEANPTADHLSRYVIIMLYIKSPNLSKLCHTEKALCV